MKRKYLTVLFAAACGLSTGCASSEKASFWANPLAGTRPQSTPAASESGTSAVASLKEKFSRKENKELSPEFVAAQKTLKKHPEKTLIAWARYQEDIGEYAEARKMYRELQIAYPDNIEADLGMARIELLTGRSQQAHEILRQLVTDQPKNLEVRLALGRMYSQQEKWSEAIGAFEEACEIDPEDQTCRYELGVAFAQAGKYDQALSHLTYSVGEPAAHYNIGYILHEQGRDADATEWFRNALHLHPDNQTAQKSKAMLAKLAPADSTTVGSQMIANQQPPESRSRPVSIRDLHIPASAPASMAAAKQDGVQEELPVVSSGRQHAVGQLPPVSVAPSVTAAEQSVIVTSTPFRTVSQARPVSEAERQASSEQPAQWHGPSRTASATTATEAPAPRDPAMWRARKN